MRKHGSAAAPSRAALRIGLSVALGIPVLVATAASSYYPPPGSWAKKAPAEVGMDAGKLDEAITFARAHESGRQMDFSDQERIFGSLPGSIPTRRAHTNGLVVYKGYVVAEFGDTTWVDPTYSVAKSMLSTVAAIATRDGSIRSLDEAVGATVSDGGYESPRNSVVTWKMHLQQESELEGSM